MTTIEARMPGTRCGWSYETKEPANDIERWLGFLRNRGFTEIVRMSDDVRPVLKRMSGAECSAVARIEKDQDGLFADVGDAGSIGTIMVGVKAERDGR